MERSPRYVSSSRPMKLGVGLNLLLGRLIEVCHQHTASPAAFPCLQIAIFRRTRPPLTWTIEARTWFHFRTPGLHFRSVRLRSVQHGNAAMPSQKRLHIERSS